MADRNVWWDYDYEYNNGVPDGGEPYWVPSSSPRYNKSILENGLVVFLIYLGLAAFIIYLIW